MTPTTTTHVTLSQIARTAWTGRAAVADWRRRHGDFPPRTGGTEASPLFDRAAAEQWLLARDRLPRFTTPAPADRAGARLAGLQLTRTLMPGVLAGQFVNDYETTATQDARTALALLRDHACVADTLTQTAPLLLELGCLTASALATLNGYDRDRIEAWLTARERTARAAALADPGDIGASTDVTAVEVTQIAAEALWAADRNACYPQHAERTARRVWAQTSSRQRDAGRVRYELALSAGWLAAYVLAPALGADAQRIDAHLAALSRRIIDTGDL